MPLVGMPLREQVLLPRRISTDGADLAHFPSNTGPLFCPTATVLTVHDVLQLDAWKRWPSVKSLRSQAIALYSSIALRKAIRRATVVITDSHASRRSIMARIPLPGEQLVVVYPGVRGLFAVDGPAGPLPNGVGKEFILAIGSLEPHKNAEGVMQAYARLSQSVRRRIQLVLVCTDASAKGAFIKRAAALGIAPVLVTRADDAMLASLYRRASMFVFPSFAEGFGMPVLEAMASGTPVIAGDAASLPEVVGDAGLLVPPGDSARLTRAIEMVIEDSNLRGVLVDRGLARARSFSWERCAIETLAVYERALLYSGRSVGCRERQESPDMA